MGDLTGKGCICQESFGDLQHILHPHQPEEDFLNPQSLFYRTKRSSVLPIPATGLVNYQLLTTVSLKESNVYTISQMMEIELH